MAKSSHPLYNRWINMHYRCYDPRYHAYADYGGRGITVCDRWHDFEKFCQDVSMPPEPSFELDRVKSDDCYGPETTRWVSKQINQANRRCWNKNGLPRGVRAEGKKFYAQICIDRKNYRIGNYQDAAEAGKAFLAVFFEWYGFMPQGKK